MPSEHDRLFAATASSCLLAEHGETVVYRPARGDLSSITVDIARGRCLRSFVDDGQVQARRTTITAATSDASSPGPGDVWTFDGLDWAHEEIGETSGGMVTIQVVRHETLERTRQGYRRDR